MSTMTVELRPVAEGDEDFLVRLYATTREAELDLVAWPPGHRDAFVRMQYDAQSRQYRGTNPEGSFDLVVVWGRPVGRLYVDRRPEDIRIVDISLLPEARGRGLGSRLVADVQSEAAATGRSVSLHVEVHNRAASLYARLGFTPVAEHGIYRRLEWRAS